MNTASSTPVRTAEYSTPNGESQLSSGEIESAGTLSKIRRTKTAPANRSRTPTWPMVRIRWRWADSSVPITQMAVITTMITTANAATACSERNSGLPSPCSSPSRSNV